YSAFQSRCLQEKHSSWQESSGEKKGSNVFLVTRERPAAQDSRVLPLWTIGPNRCDRVNRDASRTCQSAMSSPILSPPKLFLRLAHPVRDHKNANQLLDSNTTTLRQSFQFQEYSTIKNLHEFH